MFLPFTGPVIKGFPAPPSPPRTAEKVRGPPGRDRSGVIKVAWVLSGMIEIFAIVIFLVY